jgi:GNAT superfamily N-acetyltransferase
MSQQNFSTLGDLAQASALMRQSWLENKDQALDYNSDFLKSCYAYPATDAHLSPALYDESGNLLAFVSAFPRQVLWNGRPRRLALLTFFTVAPAAKGRGLGTRVWAECLERARAAGYDGAIHYCVDGNKSNFVTVAAARSLGHTCDRVFTVNYLIRLLQPSEFTTPAGLGSASVEQAEALFERLAAELTSKIPFCRLWNPEEIHWNCGARYGGLTEVHPSGRGLLTAYTLKTASSDATPCLFIEDVLWHHLPERERDELLKQLLNRASATAQLAVAPLWGYAPTETFVKAGFRRSTRALHTYLTLWNNQDLGGPPLPMYIDVF